MEPLIGEIRIFAFGITPRGWLACNGVTLAVATNQALFSILGTKFGGNGSTTFRIPNMQGNVPLGAGTGAGLTGRSVGSQVGEPWVTVNNLQMPAHAHSYQGKATVATTANTTNPAQHFVAEVSEKNLYSTAGQEDAGVSVPIAAAGGTQPHNNMQPYLAMNFCIAANGVYPSRDDGYPSQVDAFTGEIRMFAGDFAPSGWALCNGGILPIQQFSPLYALLGAVYGGDGRTTFALPDLRGRVPLGTTQGPGVPSYNLGEKGGVEGVTLSLAEMPMHTHTILSTPSNSKMRYANGSSSGDSASPAGKYAAIVPGLKQYGKTASVNKTGAVIKGSTPIDGGNQPHNNMQPSLGVNFIICLSGEFPSRS